MVYFEKFECSPENSYYQGEIILAITKVLKVVAGLGKFARNRIEIF